MAKKVRTDFPTAVQQILKVLEGGEPFTLSKLSQETDLNFRTVKKAVEFIQASQKRILEMNIDVTSTSGNLTIVQAKDRSGLALYPQDIQRLIVKTAYYPTTTREEEMLAYLLIHGATSASRAQPLPEDAKLKELIEAEHVAKTADGKKRRYYLTSDGQLVAKGALKLYPELKNAGELT